MEFLFYVLFAVAVVGLIFLGKLLKVKDNETKFAKLILEIVDLVNAKVEWKYSGSLTTVIDYAIMALNVVEETNDCTDYNKLKELVKNKATEICVLNGIEVDDDFVNLLGNIVDILIEKK